MILKHLIKKSDFKRYVENINLPVTLMEDIVSPVSWEHDLFLKSCVKYSNSLGYHSIENGYARIEKRKLIYRVLSYLLRNDYSCDAIFRELYSSNTPDADQKIIDLQDRHNDGFWIRQRHITALEQIHGDSAKLACLFSHFKNTAEYPVYDENQKHFDYYKMKSAIDFLYDTDKYKGRKLSGKMSIAEMAVHLRNEKIADLNNQLTDAQIKGLWLKKYYQRLSNANLERIGELLCDSYKSIYRKEIAEYKDEIKRNYNRERYTPQKALSAKEKKEKVAAMKAEGYTQKQTAERLDISESSVYRYWNN
jgi:predicted transcriptional regulator